MYAFAHPLCRLELGEVGLAYFSPSQCEVVHKQVRDVPPLDPGARTRLRPPPVYLCGMSLRLRKKPPARSRSRRGRLEVPRFAHNAALHYLARANEYQLDETERRQLTEGVRGFAGRCDEAAARAGLEWMRDVERRKGERVRS
jgi:hypothetical protein